MKTKKFEKYRSVTKGKKEIETKNQRSSKAEGPKGLWNSFKKSAKITTIIEVEVTKTEPKP